MARRAAPRVRMMGGWKLAVWILSALLFAQAAHADGVTPVQRSNYAHVLEGLWDFDSYSAAPLPGTHYMTRLPFEGVIADTYFNGQIPSMGSAGASRFGANAGTPAAPLAEGSRQRRTFSELHLVQGLMEADNVSLTSHLPDIASFGKRDFLGHGAIVLKFTDAQYVVGFDLLALKAGSRNTPKIQMRLFDIEGRQVAADLVLEAQGRYTFATQDHARKIKGIEFTNLGQMPFAIDNLVFELTKFIG